MDFFQMMMVKRKGGIYDWDKKEEYEEHIRYWEQELENFSENS